ncbi:MAG: hypothetical protein ACKOPO_09405 [Novosphingobium sp.]
MSKFPVITGPCPYKSRLAELMEGSTCSMCKREVHDLTAMNEPDRRTFLAACEGSVCVSYKVPARGAIAALAMAAAGLAALPAAAQDASSQPAADQAVPEEDYEIFVGAVKDPRKAKWTKAPKQTAPALPVVYDDEAGDAAKGKPAR